MKQTLPLGALLLILLLGPLLLRPRGEKAGTAGPPDETLIIITPHNEATRYEFGRAFAEEHFAKTGRRVLVDWRTAGGTSELARYIAAQFQGSFRDYWTNTLHRTWSAEAASAFDDPKVAPAGTGPGAARSAFLASNVGCGDDVFFGGGSFDFMQMAAAGRLADCGLGAAHPGWLGIPLLLGGEPLRDAQGRWVGACLAAFGICYNTDSVARLGISHPPAAWADLADPRYRNELALADPTQSGSVAKAFEMLLQQQMAAAPSPEEGWRRGFQLIQRIAANARYFTDSATEIPYSVQIGDAAAGMCVDFYGRFESEAVRRADGSSRLQYLTPEGGSSTGADPMALFRGAPHPELGREFIEFVLSEAGQKLWCFRAGTPGGPEKYTLRRLPIRPDLYGEQWRPFQADPGVAPYRPGAAMVYHPEWTGSLFRVISFAIRTAFIDPQQELHAAWEALIAAGFPPRATAEFSDVSAVDFTQASGPIRAALRSPDKIGEVEMARMLDEHFRAQYRRAARPGGARGMTGFCLAPSPRPPITGCGTHEKTPPGSHRGGLALRSPFSTTAMARRGPKQVAAWLPAGTSLFEDMPDLHRTEKRWPATALAQILAEPQVQAFLEKPRTHHAGPRGDRPPHRAVAKDRSYPVFPRRDRYRQRGEDDAASSCSAFLTREQERIFSHSWVNCVRAVQKASPAGKSDIVPYGSGEIETFTMNGYTEGLAYRGHWLFLASDHRRAQSRPGWLRRKTCPARRSPIRTTSRSASRRCRRMRTISLFVQPKLMADELRLTHDDAPAHGGYAPDGLPAQDGLLRAGHEAGWRAWCGRPPSSFRSASTTIPLASNALKLTTADTVDLRGWQARNSTRFPPDSGPDGTADADARALPESLPGPGAYPGPIYPGLWPRERLSARLVRRDAGARAALSHRCARCGQGAKFPGRADAAPAGGAGAFYRQQIGRHRALLQHAGDEPGVFPAAITSGAHG